MRITPEWMKRVHLALALFWALNIPIGLIFGWFYSVLYVSIVSVYANIGNHLGGWSAERPTEVLCPKCRRENVD